MNEKTEKDQRENKEEKNEEDEKKTNHNIIDGASEPASTQNYFKSIKQM